MARGHPPPVFEPAEQDLDPVAAFVAALVMLHRRLALLAARDAGAYPLVFRRFAEPIGVVSARQSTSGRLSQGARTDVVADVSCRDEQVERTSLAIEDGMTFVFMPPMVRPIRRPRPRFDARTGRRSVGFQTVRPGLEPVAPPTPPSIITVFFSPCPAASPVIVAAKMPRSRRAAVHLQRFQRLQSVL